MALELVLGPVIGVAFGELLKVVLDVKQKSSSFQPMLKRLEKTLRVVIPRLEEISRFHHQLNLEHNEMKELLVLLYNGKTLLDKCGNISPINLVKKVQYAQELLDLENELLWFFTFVLPLENARDNKVILAIVKEMCMKNAPNADQDSFIREKPKIYEDSMEQETLDFFSEKQLYIYQRRVQIDQNYREGAEEMFDIEDSDLAPTASLLDGLVGGALIGAGTDELLKRVLKAKNTTSKFELIFQQLESTLNMLIPKVDAIRALNDKFNLQQDQVEEFQLLVKNGLSLIFKCSQTSSINYLKKPFYDKKLHDFDTKLKEYFLLLLPSYHFKSTLEVLKVLRDLPTKLYGETSSDDRASDSVYQNKDGTCLFLLKVYPNDLVLADLSNCEWKALYNRQSTSTTYRFKMKFGYVVLKALRPDLKMNNNEFRERMEEIGKIGTHPHIILPFGYICYDFHRFLLYDYSAQGSFEKHLTEPIDVRTRQDWDKKLKIVLGIAKGINYMHSQWGVVHGNIKSSNIFLTGDLNGCLSDFGIDPTMHLPETASPETSLGKLVPKLVPKCSAPELKLTKEADVYNFGVMLSEIQSLYGYHLLWHWNVSAEQDQIARIAGKCANKDQEKRPRMGDVVQMIQKVISKENI